MAKDNIFAFVLMPFSKEFDDIYQLGIKEAANSLGINAERVDEQIYSEGILERIYRQIEAADIIIADMSGKNPNVFYEVGYAHAHEKLCILLTSDPDDIPFDLKHKRHLIYNGNITDLKSKILVDLNWAKSEIENIKKSHIEVKLKGQSGNLEKTQYKDIGEIDFIIDLYNNSNKESADIEMAYLYTSSNWKLYQNNKECPRTTSDINLYTQRHFLDPPVKKLSKQAWAQIKFSAKRTLASSLKGEELKDSYPIKGRAVLRLINSKGSFDYELNINTVAELIPF
jgi:hypothetical protein